MEVMMKKTTNWMPAVRHRCSQYPRVVYTLCVEAVAAVDALMRISLEGVDDDNLSLHRARALLDDGIVNSLVATPRYTWSFARYWAIVGSGAPVRHRGTVP